MTKVFIAEGDTFPHRQELQEWGWHWDAQRRAWVEDNGSDEDELCIRAIRDLPGVAVTVGPDRVAHDFGR